MSKLATVSVFILVLFIQHINADKEQVVTECLAEHNINKETFDYFRNTAELPGGGDENMKCTFLCVSKKMGWTGDGASIDKDKIIEYVLSKYPAVDKEKYKSIITTCAERSETSACEKWYQFTKCQLKAHLSFKQETP